MADRKLLKLFDKTFIQYIWSFLLVLLVPLGILFLIYNRYFFSLYQDEVFYRYSTEIETLETEMVNQIQWMRTVAGQLENQQICRRDNIQKDAPNYSQITNTFASIVSPQKFFSSMGFYSSFFTDTVFTSQGTYNLKYYKQYIGENGNILSLQDITDGITEEKWFTPDQIYAISGGMGEIYDFIIPISYSQSGYIIFSIPEQSFRRLAGDSDFIILDQSGSILFSNFIVPDGLTEIMINTAESSTRLDDGKMLFCRKSLETGLCFGLLYPEETILKPIQDTQSLFLAFFFLLLALGGILVFGMARLNYRPIKKLSEIASSHVQDIPQELSGTNAVGYALKSMDRQMKKMKELACTERAILGLVYGRDMDERKVKSNLCSAGLPEDADSYGTMLVYMRENNVKDIIIEIFKQVLSSHALQIGGMEYPAGGCYLFVVANMQSEEQLSIIIYDTVEKILQRTGQPIHVVVGKFSTDPRELRNSFRHAVQVQHGMIEDTKVWFYRDTGTINFYYPNLEIQSLYRSLLQLDADRFSLMYNTLLDALKCDGLSTFTIGAIYCDIINSCLMGMQGIKPGAPEIETIYSGLYCDMDIQTLAEIAEKVQGEALNQIQAELSKQEGVDDVVKKIMEYIDENYKKEDINVSYVAQAFELSVSNLSHRFKAQTGKNISDYIKEKRLQYMKELLEETSLTIRDIAIRLGYTQPSNFIRTFKTQTGMTPNEFRAAQAENHRIDSEKDT